MLKEVLPTGKKIKKLRKQNGLSQDWFSKFADIPHNMIIKLEFGNILDSSINTLQKLAKAIDVSLND